MPLPDSPREQLVGRLRFLPGDRRRRTLVFSPRIVLPQFEDLVLVRDMDEDLVVLPGYHFDVFYGAVYDVDVVRLHPVRGVVADGAGGVPPCRLVRVHPPRRRRPHVSHVRPFLVVKL